jgi:hypothetical protein
MSALMKEPRMPDVAASRGEPRSVSGFAPRNVVGATGEPLTSTTSMVARRAPPPPPPILAFHRLPLPVPTAALPLPPSTVERRRVGDRQPPVMESNLLEESNVLLPPPLDCDAISEEAVSLPPGSHRRNVFILKNDGVVESSAEDVDTAVLMLSPLVLQQLRAIAPKKTRSKVAYVLLLAIGSVVASVAGPRSTRELLLARWQHSSRSAPAAQEAAPRPALASTLVVDELRTEAPAAAAASPAAPPLTTFPPKVDRRLPRAGRKPPRH